MAEKDDAPAEGSAEQKEEEKKIECHSKNRILLTKPLPSFVSFNLNWGERPSHSELLKMLLSIPSLFCTDEIYESSEEVIEKNYAIRGMICFSEGHYFSFFR